MLSSDVVLVGTLLFVGADGVGGLSDETFSAAAFLSVLFFSTFFVGSGGGFNATGL